MYMARGAYVGKEKIAKVGTRDATFLQRPPRPTPSLYEPTKALKLKLTEWSPQKPENRFHILVFCPFYFILILYIYNTFWFLIVIVRFFLVGPLL